MEIKDFVFDFKNYKYVFIYNIKINITLKYIKFNFMILRLKSKNFLLKFSIAAFLN